MERPLIKFFFIGLLFVLTEIVHSTHHEMNNFGLVIHGGSGTYSGLTETSTKAYKKGIDTALEAGYRILKKGGTSLDAVTAAVIILEDLPQFNAGKGAVYTSSEVQEMDASIMDGTTGKGGAVASISRIKNPILLSRAVMEKSEHVMLVGKGAEQFATTVGIDLVDPSYFHSEKNLNILRKNKKDQKLGTVGAVALDKKGNLSAATSTGGRSNKMPGRVGDSPILGAGTWAQNGLCAVSGTGHGEYFMRLLTAADVCKLMEYSNLTLKDSSDKVIKKLTVAGGAGGIISIDSKGNISTPFNTKGMVRGYQTNKISKTIKIYKDI